jgi:hypothetical protein
MTDKTDKPPMKVVSIGTTPPEEDKLEVNEDAIALLEGTLEMMRVGEITSIALAGVTVDGNLFVDYSTTRDALAQWGAVTRLSKIYDSLVLTTPSEEL